MVGEIREFAKKVTDNVEQVIVGKQPVIELLIVALLCEGHVLIEDVPGVGKTMLARAVAISLGVSFRRLQCTPDILPNDVTGVSVFNQKTREFDFIPGPAFAHILLADEVNRATPRTQSALLASRDHCPDRSWSWPRRTPSNTRAPFLYLRRSSTASCSSLAWAISMLRLRARCCCTSAVGTPSRA